MKIDFFCPRWGSEHLPWERFLEKAGSSGYDGIEWGVPNNTPRDKIEKVFHLAARQGLKIILQHYETSDADFDEHRKNYLTWLANVRGFPSVKVNSQTGKDFFSFEQNRELIEMAEGVGKEIKIPVVHETHRGKFSFAAATTKEYLESIPSLRLTLDISHWVCVSESWLEDQPSAVSLAISRTDHIHARVGYPEGPQVPDPSVPEWKGALDKHMGWWMKVIEEKEKKGDEMMTITTEFGPHPYMVNLPGTNQLIGDQWRINLFMMEAIKSKQNSIGCSELYL